MKPLAYPALGLALLIPFATAQADSLGGYPNPSDPCLADRQASYTAGYTAGAAAGDASGYARGYAEGFGAGTAQQLAQCVADPQSCGITLSTCLPDPSYGETEPNDNLISADPLKLEVNFWGQSYGSADQDWFYTETTAPNQNLIVNFSVPEWVENADLAAGIPATWNLTIRDAAGNVFANFDTSVLGAVASPKNAATYTVTLGLVGTYYLVVQQADKTQNNAYTYGLAAILQDSDLEGNQPIVGFADAEIEPNDVPSRANPLANGVSMYGLINLTFNFPLLQDDTYVWGQGENDWFVYQSKGDEIITLTFCAKELCGPGNWFVQVYDQAVAQQLEAGASYSDVKPLLAFNTDTVNQPSATFRLGLRDPGYYFMRVNHKRLFNAPCNEYRYVNTSGGFESGFAGVCTCDTEAAQDTSAAANSCYLPSNLCSETDNEILCTSKTETCNPGLDPGCLSADGQDGRPQYPADCPILDAETGEVSEPCATYQTLARCSCSSYGGVVEVPENEYTSPYNFTWHGTQLPPNTIDTEAYEEYLKRLNPYN